MILTPRVISNSTIDPKMARELNYILNMITHDLSEGHVAHKIYTVAPTTSDLDVGEIGLGVSAGKLVIYANIDGVIYST